MGVIKNEVTRFLFEEGEWGGIDLRILLAAAEVATSRGLGQGRVNRAA